MNHGQRAGGHDGTHDTTMLVRRGIDGDVECLGRAVERLSPLLLAYAGFRLGRLQRHVDAHELVQEAWLTVLPRLGELVPREGRLTPVLVRYLASTIRNRVRNLLRAEVRRAGTVGIEPNDEAVPVLPAEQSGVVTKVIRSELSDRIAALLTELTADDREIVLLRCIEQLPNETVGVIVSMSAEAVSKRYQRALLRIRRRLPGSAFDEFEPD
jgi:RNA polymerase sigma factor (sigma-70 family)